MTTNDPGNDPNFSIFAAGENFSVRAHQNLEDFVIRKSSITIKDIARRLGISTSTVSRALSGNADVNEKTREAVLELAAQLDYQPNVVAQSLKRQQTNLVGVVIPESSNPFFAKALSGIMNIANPNGFNVITLQSSESQEIEMSNIDMLIHARVDGVLVSVSIGTRQYDHFRKLQKKGIPLVFFDRIVEEIDAPKVVTDNYEIAYQATKELIAIGCRRIARISGPLHLYSCQWRLKGYKDALAQHGLPARDEYVVYSQYDAQDVELYTKRLMNLPEPPDGIFAINDKAAIAIIKTLKSLGYKVPGNVAVIGFNNDFYGEFVEPTLSSIEVPAYEMGRSAMQVLLENIRMDQPVNHRIVIPSRLAVRQSTLKGAKVG